MKRYSIVLLALVIHGFLLCIGCRDRGLDNNGQSGWYIVDPSLYYHVNHSQQNDVLYWLQSKPTNRPIGPNLKSSPYNLDEWIKKGRDIPNIENHLIDLYRDYTGNVHLGSILEAFRFVGTFRSVPLLVEAVDDIDLDISDRAEAVGALGVIGDPLAVPSLIRLLHEKEDVHEYSDQINLKRHAFGMLVDIGDPRAIAFLEEWLKNVQLPTEVHAYYEKLINLLNQNQSNFIQDWILRWHLDNTNRNSKNLPYFRSKKIWAIAGKEIPGVNRILFDIYREKENKVNKYSILVAIGAVGSNQDIQPLYDLILNDSEMEPQEVDAAFRSIYDIRGLQILDEIITKIDSSRFINEQSECRIKSAILTVFSGKGKDDKLVSIRNRYEELCKKIYPNSSMK